MCGVELGAGHQHLIETSIRKMVCTRDACAILFSGQAEMKYKRVTGAYGSCRTFISQTLSGKA